MLQTSKGIDDDIDLAYTFENGYSWTHKTRIYICVQVPASGLHAGNNTFEWHMTKGGTVTAPSPDEYLGGKGTIKIGQICLHYQRNQ